MSHWPPFAWFENDRLLSELTTTAKALGLTDNTGVSDRPAVEDWKLEEALPEYVKRCSQFIHDQKTKEQPFFLYFSMPSPHTPIVPNSEWKGKSGAGDYRHAVESDVPGVN